MAILTEQAFETLFIDWFGGLQSYAGALLKDGSEAEEVVQSVFYRLWEKRGSIPEPISPKAWLYGCVYHACIDQMRKRRSARIWRQEMGRSLTGAAGTGQPPGTATAGDAAVKLELQELETRYQDAVDRLPEQCRNIFQLSRFSGLRYREIAEQLSLSVKTVETQMTKALKRLREELAEHL